MRLCLAAVGSLKKGPEQELVARYSDRIGKSGKAVGITSLDHLEIPESRASGSAARKQQEADALIARIPEEGVVFCFDERGKSVSSRQFANAIGKVLDDGNPSLSLIIGGPDGLDPDLRARCDRVVSFGELTMPHQLVRILVLEQAYRAVTILTNHPYHRD